MKFLLVILGFLTIFSCNNKKTESKGEKTTGQVINDSSGTKAENQFGIKETGSANSLEARVSEYFQLTVDMRLENLMDYLYPRIFDQISKAELLKEMKAVFENESMKAKVDSIRIDKIYPAIKDGDGEYAKVLYSNKTIFDFKSDLEQSKKIRDELAVKYGRNFVTMDPETGIISVWSSDSMIAVKDEHSKNWTFVNAQDPSLTSKIFSNEVLNKLEAQE